MIRWTWAGRHSCCHCRLGRRVLGRMPAQYSVWLQEYSLAIWLKLDHLNNPEQSITVSNCYAVQCRAISMACPIAPTNHCRHQWVGWKRWWLLALRSHLYIMCGEVSAGIRESENISNAGSLKVLVSRATVPLQLCVNQASSSIAYRGLGMIVCRYD